MTVSHSESPFRTFPLIKGKKEEMTEERKTSRASKSKSGPPPPSSAQGLDPPLKPTTENGRITNPASSLSRN